MDRKIEGERMTPDHRDAEWVARELGDVPPRTVGATLADAGFPMLGAMVGMLRSEDSDRLAMGEANATQAADIYAGQLEGLRGATFRMRD